MIHNINIIRTKPIVVFAYSYHYWFFIIQNLSNFNIVLKHSQELKNYHYKIILYLDGVGTATQSQMSEYLGATKQRISVICIELQSMDIIKVNRKEGRNIFWELNPEPKLQIKGQVKMKGI